MNEPSPRIGKTEWIAVGACVALLIGWTYYSSLRWPTPPPKPHAASPAAATVAPEAAPQNEAEIAPAPGAPAKGKAASPAPGQTQAQTFPEARPVLDNEAIRVTFTSRGGGPAEIVLKQHAQVKGGDPIVLNTPGLDALHQRVFPAVFDIAGWSDDASSPIDYQTDAPADGSRVTFTRTLPNGLKIERTYTLAPGNNYNVRLEERLTNPGAQALTLPERHVGIGLVGPLYHNDTANTISADWMRASDDHVFKVMAPEFEAGATFFLFNRHGPRDAIAGSEEAASRWAAVKNRFFTLVVTAPDDDPIRNVVSIVHRPGHPGANAAAGGRSGAPVPALSASAVFAPVTLPAGGTRTEAYSLYAGPKEYDQLAALGQGQKALMEFGIFGWAALPLLKAMKWIHHVVPSYAWSIIILTCILKGVFWPLQSKANHSMKLMQAVAPKQKELSAKYKDDPAKMQTEVMKLYREYGVNPLGGCLPMLIQIPIFIGFYTMLQSAVEFRHESWLWIKDLVQPDTVYVIPGIDIPINPLPLIMTLSQWALMRITPQTGDAAQMKILQFMPFIMLLFFYNFASALALYWTVNNFISMIQTYRNLKKPLPTLQRVKKAKAPQGFGFQR